MGGQSAFGTKAGDLFTRITVGVAGFWIILCILATNLLSRQQSLISSELGGAAPQATAPMTPTQPMTQPQPPAAATGADAQAADESLSLPATPSATDPAAATAPAQPTAEADPAVPAETAPTK